MSEEIHLCAMHQWCSRLCGEYKEEKKKKVKNKKTIRNFECILDRHACHWLHGNERMRIEKAMRSTNQNDPYPCVEGNIMGDRSLQRLALFQEADRGWGVSRSNEIKGLSE